jgi:hypothetical protein
LVPHNYPPNQQLAQWTKRQVRRRLVDDSPSLLVVWRHRVDSNLVPLLYHHPYA